MSFRWKLLFAFGATTLVAVAVMALVATRLVRNAYVRSDQQRIEQVLAQARSAIERRGEQAARRVAAAAEDDAVTRVAIALNAAPAGAPVPPGAFLAEAGQAARVHELELLELMAGDGTVLSSAQWEARAGYREPGAASLFGRTAPFVRLEDLPSGPVLAVEVVREVSLGAHKLHVLGGHLLGQSFLRELSQAGLEHVALFRLAGEGGFRQAAGGAADVPAAVAEELQRVVERVGLGGADYQGELEASRSAVATMPVRDAAGRTLGVLVVTVSEGERERLIRSLYWTALMAGGLALATALLLSLLLARRITAPVADLVRASQEWAEGRLDFRIQPRGDDELARLSLAFNSMAASLQQHRERMVQAERVAAWRELARRLAHELKNPLFPLQLSVENLRRARQVDAGGFEEAFEEGTATLLAEIEELKRIVSRFSDFAKMPQPQLEDVDLRALLQQTARLYAARIDQGHVALELDLPSDPVTVRADPHLLGQALGNLILNALDAMPDGGRLVLRAESRDGRGVLEVTDTGQGLTEEEQRRLFTPYYTTKRHGTGLGLAFVQSVVADHGGRIVVTSAPDAGSCFRIELG
ncbi:MAG: ATP-binding protein [Acidobacteria bacterium]|nr:ATP-binding protein [Acidobacteriota bacterium]